MTLNLTSLIGSVFYGSRKADETKTKIWICVVNEDGDTAFCATLKSLVHHVGRISNTWPRESFKFIKSTQPFIQGKLDGVLILPAPEVPDSKPSDLVKLS